MKLRPAYSVKLVFSYVVKGIKVKVTEKFRVSRGLQIEDTKGIVTRNAPENFRERSALVTNDPVNVMPERWN